ncbi:spore coat protein [Caldibacillus thermolactis]|jgi:spore coat protein X|uniref:Spore coat protein n=1 Tax=Pallidibacillus thermolactis TaxID=251051 RepID=A0ABT2WH25_9BACI|nr:spore coat protein [Pallidibacillus thermolactis]MCU9593969.1 spore coat protein [Pallidibacillus thermolactis]MCU9600792.1 spore coat protein [Pallidibacillus thermolactis subsp. kokeshiiformis]MED1674954.1 spore coat protein [Pallidibacillus thermolactis subsp. kokeshiiformis]
MNQEVYRAKIDNTNNNNRWNALDPNSVHPMSLCFKDNEDVDQQNVQKVKEFQFSEEWIFIKDSCDVDVETTDTKLALSLVASLNAFITAVIEISILSSEDAEEVKQSIFQSTGIKQVNIQKTIIENSRDVKVHTTDTNIALNLQILLQIALALLINLDIL